MTFDTRFWTYLDQLVADCAITIDRPRHSRHPSLSAIIYPFDYGYLEGTHSSDGAELDVWLGSGDKTVNGIVCCVDLHKRDVELKVLLGCNSAEMQTILDFHNVGDQAATLIVRVRQNKPSKTADTS